MRRPILAVLAFLCVACAGAAMAGRALAQAVADGQAVVELMAVQTAPMSMDDPADPGGVLELVQSAAARAGYRLHITFVPWRRAQEVVATGRNILITPLTYLPVRKDKFTWIAPLCRLERTIATLGRRIDSLEQARDEKLRLAVGAGSAPDLELRDFGYPPDLIVTTPLGTREAEMLALGRADGWFSGSLQMRWRWQREGNGRPLIIGQPIQTDQIFLGCSRDCDPVMVTRLSDALAALRDDGTAGRILAKYDLAY